MNIFISGGFGLLGARSALYFSRLGFNVTIGTSSEYKCSNYKINNKIKVRLIDWENPISIEKALKGNQTILHFAGMNAQDSLKNSKEANKFNGYKTNLLLEIAYLLKVKNFIFLSTAHVYSNNLKGFFDENSPTNNKHPYAVSNIIGEKFVQEFHLNKKINAKILRLSNAFGAPVVKNDTCWNLFVNNVCKQIFMNKKVKIFSNPTINRNFITITDFNNFLFQILKKKLSCNDNIIFNVGSKKSLQLGEMAELITYHYYQYCNKKIDIIYENESNVNKDKFEFKLSINKALELGIKPRNSIKNELIKIFKILQREYS